MGREQDFTEYASARWRTLLRSAVFLGCSQHDAEDLAQATLLRAYLAWPKVVRASNPDAYVARIMLNVHRDSRRRRWWGEKPTNPLPDRAGVDQFADADVSEVVRMAMSKLSDAQREVVALRYYLELSERDTADLLRIPPGTVKSRLSSAVRLLATQLDLADLHNGDTG